MANRIGESDYAIFGLCLLITVGFQITSNFANDYGDGVKGTDSRDRIGPRRALQSGALTKTELKWGIGIAAFISVVLAIGLLVYVFGLGNLPYFILFFALAVLSVWAAIKYTVGKSAYGYRGLGDVFVFLFFGLLAVLGTKFLYVQSIGLSDFLPTIAIGALCVGVLNLNNLRDVKSDTNHGKNTLIVKIGFDRGKTYHFVLLTVSFISFLIYALFQTKGRGILFLVPYVFILIHLAKVIRTTEPVKLDPELKKLALSTFALSVLFYFTVNYFL